MWHTHERWGLRSQFLPFRYFPNFSALSKQTLVIEYHVYIWQVSPQLSCGDTCQIWMWFEKSNMYLCRIENFAYGEINERSFSNPHPWSGTQSVSCDLGITLNNWKQKELWVSHYGVVFELHWILILSLISDWSVHSGNYFSIRLGPLRWVPTAQGAGRRGLNLLTAVRPVGLAQWHILTHTYLKFNWHSANVLIP